MHDLKLLKTWHKALNRLFIVEAKGKAGTKINIYVNKILIQATCLNNISGKCLAFLAQDGWYLYSEVNSINSRFNKQLEYRKTVQKSKSNPEYMMTSFSRSVISYPFTSTIYFSEGTPRDPIEEYITPDKFDPRENESSGEAREIFTLYSPFGGSSRHEKTFDRKKITIADNFQYYEEGQNFHKSASQQIFYRYIFKDVNSVTIEIEFKVLSNYRTYISIRDFFTSFNTEENIFNPANNLFERKMKIELDENRLVSEVVAESFSYYSIGVTVIPLGQIVDLEVLMDSIEVSIEVQ